MKQQNKLILYGGAMFLEGITANFINRTDLNVMALDADDRDAAQRLHELGPNAIVFDLTSGPPRSISRLTRSSPELQLIGLGLESDYGLVMSGYQSRVLPKHELVRIIGEQSD